MSQTKNLTGIKNIIFDLGGVIINIDHQKTADEFKKLGAENFIEHFSHQNRMRFSAFTKRVLFQIQSSETA